MFQFDFFSRHTAADDASPAAETPTTETTAVETSAVGEFITFEEPAAPAAEPCTPGAAEAPAAQPQDWQPPTVGGYTAPTVSTLKTMLGYAENLLISLNSRSSLERKPTRDLSVVYTRNYVIESYETALREHNMVSYLGKLLFPLPGITVTDGSGTQYLAGILTPTFGNYSWRFAYTDEVSYTSRFDPSCYERSTIAAETVPAAPLSPADYLTGRGYKVQSISTEAETLPAVLQDLVQELAQAISDPLVADFMQDVRTNIPQNKPGHYDMSGASLASKNLLVTLLQHMSKLGLLTYLGINWSTDMVNYSVSHSDPCVRFLNGQWLELYVSDLCTRTVNEIAERYGLTAGIASNVVLTDPKEPEVPCHELDCAFTVGGVFFWLEAKSSSRNVNYDKYRIRGQLLEVIPDQFLLVNSDLTCGEVEAVRWLYPYHVANCTTLAEALRTMVTTALEASGANTVAALAA